MATRHPESCAAVFGSALHVPVVPAEFERRHLLPGASPRRDAARISCPASSISPANEDVFTRERDRFLAALSDVDPGNAAVPFLTTGTAWLSVCGRGAHRAGGVAERARHPPPPKADSDPALVTASGPVKLLRLSRRRRRGGGRFIAGARALATNEVVDDALIGRVPGGPRLAALAPRRCSCAYCAWVMSWRCAAWQSRSLDPGGKTSS